jgi:RimJ/RimL family protein N-acetyltransferase
MIMMIDDHPDPVPFASARLHFAPAAAADVPAIARLLARPAVRRFLCDGRVLPVATLAGLVAAAATRRPLGGGMWTLTDAGGLAGIIGLLPVSEAVARTVPDFAGAEEVVLALAPDRWGRGYAGEALAALLARALPGRERIVAVADAPNRRSDAMLRRAGFRPVGRALGPAFMLCLYELPGGVSRAGAAAP